MLFCAHFIQALGYSSMMLLPLYLDHLGASRAEIGVLMAVEAIGGILFRPVAAWSLDVIGRKPTIFAGTLLLIASMGLMGFVDDLGPLVYIDRVLMGFALGTLFPAYFTLAADIIPEERRTEGLALFGVGGLLPLALNSVVPTLGVSAPALRWFFPIVGAFIALSLAVVWVLPETREAGEDDGPMRLKDVARAITARRLWPVWMASVAFSGMVSVFFSFATVAADRRAIPNPASVWLTYALGAACVRILGARIPDRLGTHNMIVPAVGVYILGTFVMAGAGTSGELLLVGGLVGMGHGYCFPVLSSQVVDRSPRALRGTALTTFTAVWELARLAVTPVFGAVSDAAGDALMFASACLAGIFALAIWARLEHRHGS